MESMSSDRSVLPPVCARKAYEAKLAPFHGEAQQACDGTHPTVSCPWLTSPLPSSPPIPPLPGFFVTRISRTALRYAPRDRSAVYKLFGYMAADGSPMLGIGSSRSLLGSSSSSSSSAVESSYEDIDNAVCAELEECVKLMTPVLSHLNSFLVDAAGSDPGDTRGVKLAQLEDARQQRARVNS
jgi:hypothetical protein